MGFGWIWCDVGDGGVVSISFPGRRPSPPQLTLQYYRSLTRVEVLKPALSEALDEALMSFVVVQWLSCV